MKKFISIILIIVLSFIVVGCDKEKTDAIKFKEEYESVNNVVNEHTKKKNRELSIPKDNPFVYATADEIVKKINNKESFIVYFGFKDCPWCRSVLEELIHVAKDKNVETIYYVDVLNIRDTKEIAEDGTITTTKEGTEGYMKLVELLGDVLEDYSLTNESDEEISAGEKRIYAPNVVSISKGKALQMETGISDELTDPYSKLTKKIKKYAYKKFECLVKCLEEESNTCQKNSC
ncbi:MAG: hypothetical protein IKE63_02330 [Bacilli bacterium]|nr:hypothetical protein [Bacilli bacterium]